MNIGKLIRALCLVAIAAMLIPAAGCGRTEQTTEAIPFQTTEKDDPTVWVGESKTISEGVNGEKQVTWRVSGEQRKQVSEKITKEPVDEVVSKGTKEPGTGFVANYDGKYEVSITDVERNNAMGGDTLVVKARFNNLQTDIPLQIDSKLAIRMKNGELMYGYAHAPGDRGLTTGVTIRGADSGDVVYEFQLRPGSKLRADVSTVDDFTLEIGKDKQVGSVNGTMALRYPLSRFWIGPLESGGEGSTRTAEEATSGDPAAERIQCIDQMGAVDAAMSKVAAKEWPSGGGGYMIDEGYADMKGYDYAKLGAFLDKKLGAPSGGTLPGGHPAIGGGDSGEGASGGTEAPGGYGTPCPGGGEYKLTWSPEYNLLKIECSVHGASLK